MPMLPSCQVLTEMVTVMDRLNLKESALREDLMPIRRPTRRSLAPLALLLAFLAACGGAESPPPTADRPPSTPVQPSPAADQPSPAAGASGQPGGFSTTDVAWLQLAIAMDERFLQVLELVPGRTGEPEVEALARRLTTDHRDTLSRLRALLDASGGPTANPHEGHDMPGMATAAQLDALRRATGHAAVEIFTAALHAHLDQSIHLARAAAEHGTEPATRALAAEIVRNRSEHQEWTGPSLAAAPNTP